MTEQENTTTQPNQNILAGVSDNVIAEAEFNEKVRLDRLGILSGLLDFGLKEAIAKNPKIHRNAEAFTLVVDAAMEKKRTHDAEEAARQQVAQTQTQAAPQQPEQHQTQQSTVLPGSTQATTKALDLKDYMNPHTPINTAEFESLPPHVQFHFRAMRGGA